MSSLRELYYLPLGPLIMAVLVVGGIAWFSYYFPGGKKRD